MQILIKQTKILFDDEDLPIFRKYSWHISQGYVYRTILGKRHGISFHREIIRHHFKIDPKEIDHINGIGTDNRKENLRACTRTQNIFNAPKYKMNALSKYKGVTIHKPYKKWSARISFQNKDYHLISSINEDLCAYAYNIAAKLLAKEFAYLNEIKNPIAEDEMQRVQRVVELILKSKKLI